MVALFIIMEHEVTLIELFWNFEMVLRIAIFLNENISSVVGQHVEFIVMCLSLKRYIGSLLNNTHLP